MTLLLALSLMGPSLAWAQTLPPAETPGGAKASPKPMPPKLDKDKNCQWGHEAEIVVDLHHLTISQETLRTVIHGSEASVDDYTLFADRPRMVLFIRSPEGSWFSADLMRLGDENEGCIFYYIGPVAALPGEPPL